MHVINLLFTHKKTGGPTLKIQYIAQVAGIGTNYPIKSHSPDKLFLLHLKLPKGLRQINHFTYPLFSSSAKIKQKR